LPRGWLARLGCAVAAAGLLVWLRAAKRRLCPPLSEVTPISRRNRAPLPEVAAPMPQRILAFTEDLKAVVPPATRAERKIARLVEEVYRVLVAVVDRESELGKRPPPKLRISVDKKAMSRASYTLDKKDASESITYFIGEDGRVAQAPFLLAHELGHAVAQHSLGLMGARIRWMKATRLLGVWHMDRPVEDRELSEGNPFLAVYLSLQRRLHEFEADHIGGVIFSRAGFHPVAYVRSLAWLGMQAEPNGPLLFRSHPTSVRRMQYMVYCRDQVASAYNHSTKAQELWKRLADSDIDTVVKFPIS